MEMKLPITAVLMEPTPDGWRITYTTRKHDGTNQMVRETAVNLDRAFDQIGSKVCVNGWLTNPPTPKGRP